MNATTLTVPAPGRCVDCGSPTGDAIRYYCEADAKRREAKLDGFTLCRKCGENTGDQSADFCADCATEEGVCNGCGESPNPKWDVGAPICDACYFSP